VSFSLKAVFVFVCVYKLSGPFCLSSGHMNKSAPFGPVYSSVLLCTISLNQGEKTAFRFRHSRASGSSNENKCVMGNQANYFWTNPV